MFKLQLSWCKTGDWEDTVYPHMAYADALSTWRQVATSNKEHGYRIIYTGASK